MSIKDISRIGLLCIDTQQAFSDVSRFARERSNPHFEKNFEALLTAFRSKRGPKVFHVQHSSLSPTSFLHPSAGNGNYIKFMPYAEPQDDEPVVVKHFNGGFTQTKLEEILKANKLEALFICGLILDHCVSTTTRMAKDLRVADRIVLVQDATATFNRGAVDAEIVHRVSYESLRDEFAEIMNTDQVLKALDEVKDFSPSYKTS